MTVAALALAALAGWLWPGAAAPPGDARGAGAARRLRALWRKQLSRRGPEEAAIGAGAAAAAALLVAACLEAGATPAAALRQAAQALEGDDEAAAADALHAAAAELEAGAGPPAALSAGPLRTIGAVLGRGMLTGSAMSSQLVDAAEQLRQDAQFTRLERARRLAVLAALPLGACLLPAFVLLAVVPAVLGLRTAF